MREDRRAHRLSWGMLLLAGCTWISDDALDARLAANDPACTDEVWYDGIDEACDGGSDDDQDGDGWDRDDDCDDTRAAVNPGAAEDCATPEDDDCDGLTDASDALGCTPWYEDLDRDGYGTDASACFCAPSLEFLASVAGDCDDADAAVNPGAVEVCDADQRDEDCDGLADDDPGEAAWGRTVYFPDADGDGQGDATAGGTPSCVALEAGWSAYGADCDDTSAAVYVGADEIAADGVDQDCDGGDTCYVDADADGYRDPTALVASADLDCAGPGESADAAEDCDDANAAIPGVEAWNGIDDDCDGTVDDLDVATVADGALHGGSAYLGLGASHTLALGGDVDGDGAGDLLLLSETGTTGYGWLVSGAAAVGASAAVDTLASASLTGQSANVLSHVVGPLSDVTGDGRADLLVVGSSTNTGRAWLLDGVAAAGEVPLATAYTAQWDGDSANDALRYAAAGDLDGDGVGEVVVSAIYDHYVGTYYTSDYYTGNVSVYAGGAFAGAYTFDDADDQVHGADDYDYLGQSLAVADFDGDGYTDFAAGAPGDDEAGSNAGAIYVFLGNNLLLWTGDRADEGMAFAVDGHTASLALGNDPLPTPGDLAGAGRASLALGSSVSGEAWVFFDPAALSGHVALTSADAGWSGTASSFATALAAASDMNGDGVADLAVGASGDDTAAVDAGAVFLFLGGGAWTPTMTAADADVAFYGSAADDQLGAGLAAGGDATGDGVADLLLGAPGTDTLTTNGGAVWVVAGR